MENKTRMFVLIILILITLISFVFLMSIGLLLYNLRTGITVHSSLIFRHPELMVWGLAPCLAIIITGCVIAMTRLFNVNSI